MEDLCVEKGTGLVRRVGRIHGAVISDEPYKPNGKLVFVNPETGFLEETERVPLLSGRQRKTNNLISNGHEVIFHPDHQEFAEVTPGYGFGNYDKVKDLPIA